MDKQYIYRLHIWVRLVMVGITVVPMLGAYGIIFEEGSMSTSESTQYLCSTLFSLAVFYGIFSPYKKGYLYFKDNELSIPSIWIPPFKPRIIQYNKILDYKIKTGVNKDGVESMHLKVYCRGGMKFKIDPTYCYSKKLFSTIPDDIYRIEKTLKKIIANNATL